MAIKQIVWSLDEKRELSASSLLSEKELEDLIADNIGLLSENWLVIGRQVHTAYGGVIDLLCIDMGGNRIIVELKRSLTPREVTAQTLDYASWAKEIDADALAQIYLKYTDGKKPLSVAYRERFGVEMSEENDDIDVQAVIVATDMDGSTERILMFLQNYGININVLFFKVFEHQGKRLLSRAWMFEAEPSVHSRRDGGAPWNGEYYFSFGVDQERSWEDAIKYCFLSAGGGSWYTGTMKNCEPGNRVWVNIPRTGYVGVGIIADKAAPARETIILLDGNEKPFFDLDLHAKYHKDLPAEKEEYIIKVDWIKTVPKDKAVSEYGFFGNQNTMCQPRSDKWEFTVRRLKELWDIVD